MSGSVDLNPNYLETVMRILAEHVPKCEVRVFGSRSSWTAKDYSDLDLAIVGEGPLDRRTLGRLKVAFEESNLPMRLDVLDWHATSESFREVIERDYVVVQEGSGKQPTAREWREVTLGDVCTKIGSGATPRGGRDVYLEEGPYTLIRSQNVYNDGFHRDGLAFIGEHHADELKNVEVSQDDVLLNITGDSVARVCQVAPDVLPARVNQHVAIIRPDSFNLDASYLRYCLVSPEMQILLLSWAGSGGTRNALTKGMIESLEIPIPPLPTQRAIAHILGTLDDKIELNRRMNERLEAMARAIFQDWFVDFGPTRAKMEGRAPYLPPEVWSLFPGRLADSELGPIPEGWEVRALGEVCEINPARLLRKGAVAPYLDMANMPTNGHTPDEVTERPFGSGMRFVNGDTLVARITPCLENGKTAYVDFLQDGEVGWGSTEYIVLKPKPPLPEEFAYCLARSATFREFAIQNMTGTSGRQRVPVAAMFNYQLPLPSECQVAEVFGELVKPLFSLVSWNTEESRTLSALRDALLPRLVSGEVGVGESTNGR